MYRQFKYILPLLWMSVPSLVYAQTDKGELDVLRGMLRQSVLYNSQGLQSGGIESIKKVDKNYPTVERYKSWYAMKERNMRGEAEGMMPGSVTSWMVSFPYDCPSVSDFSLRGDPETQGFSTDKESVGARFPALGWVRYEATGNRGTIEPLQVMDSQGFSAFYLVARIKIEAKSAVSAMMEMPSNTQIIGWMNGKKIVENVHGNMPDVSIFGDRYPVTLQPGENILVVKVASLEKPPEFYTFLTDAKTGRPLDFVVDNADPIEVKELAGGEAVVAKDSVLKEIYQDPKSSLAMRALVARLTMDEVAADGEIQNLLLSNIDKSAWMTPSELEIAALTLNAPDKSLVLLKKALENNPNDEQLRLIYVNEMIKASSFQGNGGGRFADEWPELSKLIPEHAPVVEGRSYELMKERILAQVELNYHHPNTVYKRIEEASCSKECKDVLLQLIVGTQDYYSNRGRYKNILEELYSNHRELSGYLVDLLKTELVEAIESGEGQKVVSTLVDIENRVEQFLLLHPYDEYIWNFWLDLLERYGLDAAEIPGERKLLLQQSGFHSDADSRYQMYLSMRPNDADRWIKYATFAMNRGLYEDAVAAYDFASRLRPQDETIAERSHLVGEWLRSNQPENEFSGADSAIIASYEKPYIITDIPGNHFKDASGVVNLLHNRVVRILPDGLTSTFTQMVFEVMDEQGVKLARSNGISYLPAEEKVEILGVTVTKKDGTVRKMMYQTEEYSMGDEAYRLFYDNRYIAIEVSDLDVGDRVEYRFKRTTLQKSSSSILHFSDVFQLQGTYDQQWHKYTVIAPESLKIHLGLHQPNLELKPAPVTEKKENGLIVTSFEQKDMKRFIPEDRMPGMSEVVPMLFVSSFNDWQEIVEWNFDLVKPQWQINDAIRNEVRRLTDGVTDRLEKLKRIHEFVVKSTRYVGLEYGIHGVKPYPVSQIFERRFGDCKDKASLLKVMLDEAGIPANYTVIRTIDSGDVNPAQPMPYYFNHAIVYVPEFDLFLDGTAEFSGIHELPQMDQGGFAFVMKDEGTYELTHAPVSTEKDNYQEDTVVFDLTHGDQIHYTVNTVVHGVDASQYRYRFQVKELQKEYYESRLAQTYPGSKLESVVFSDLEQINEDVRIAANAVTTRTDLIKVSGDTWLVYPLATANHIVSTLAPLASRKTPSMGVLPMTQKKSVTWVLPDGVSFSVPEPISEKSKFGSYDVQVTYENHRLSTTATIQLTQFRIMPVDYPEYVDFLQKLEHRLNAMYKLEVGHEN